MSADSNMWFDSSMLALCGMILDRHVTDMCESVTIQARDGHVENC